MKTAAVVALCALLAFPALAKEREGVQFPETIEAGGQQVHLSGVGLRKKLWIKVYLAALYLQNPTKVTEVITSDQVKRVNMHMLRDLERGKIVEAVQDGFAKNAGPNLPQLKSRLDTFTKAIPDLKAGQNIVITYVPGRGTLLKAGGGDEVSIEGKDFADALFSVWLGSSPVDDDLKHEMLTNR
jgi:hypothetical protein